MDDLLPCKACGWWTDIEDDLCYSCQVKEQEDLEQQRQVDRWKEEKHERQSW